MKTFLSIAIPVVFLGLCGLLIWYVSFRLRVLFRFKRRWPLRTGIGIAFMSSLFFMFSGSRFTSESLGNLSILAGHVFCFILILTMLLLALHAIQSRWPSLTNRWAGLSVLVLGLLITVSGALHANDFEVTEIDIPLDGLKSDVVLMHMPDIHVGHHRGKAYLAKIVAETNRHKPDMVLINGDLVDSNVALQTDALSPLSDLEAPVFFTGGNHENYVDTEEVLKRLTGYGATVLHNEVVEIRGIYLVGLDYMNPDENTFDMHPSKDKRTIKGVLRALPLKDDKPSVLMHHSPVGVGYAAEKGIDLMLSGHTHAGQVFPATLLGVAFFPFLKGLYQEQGTKLFVSQGAGTYGPRVRLGSNNEINLIRLRTK